MTSSTQMLPVGGVRKSQPGKRMDPQAKMAFVQALRSGDFDMTTGVLCRASEDGTENGSDKHLEFCAMGVLTEIARGSGAVTVVRRRGGVGSRVRAFFDKISGNEVTTHAPQSVLDWAGMDGRMQDDIITMNDSRKMTFASIADWVEKFF